MLHYNLESKLQSHVLGRSLLSMPQGDGNGLQHHPRHISNDVVVDHFLEIREILASIDATFNALTSQVMLSHSLECHIMRMSHLQSTLHHSLLCIEHSYCLASLTNQVHVTLFAHVTS